MSVVMGKHDAGYCILGTARDFNIVILPFKERFRLNQMFNVSVIICSLGSKLYFLIVTGLLLIVTPKSTTLFYYSKKSDNRNIFAIIEMLEKDPCLKCVYFLLIFTYSSHI